MEQGNLLYCNKGHLMQTRSTVSGIEARCNQCETLFGHLSGLLRGGLATRNAPKLDPMAKAMIAAQDGPKPWG